MVCDWYDWESQTCNCDDKLCPIFYDKEHNKLCKVQRVVNDQYDCYSIKYYNNLGTYKLQKESSRSFIINYEYIVESFDNMKCISEKEANEILDKWKKDCVNLHF